MDFRSWINDRFPVAGIKSYLNTITVPRHKHTFWYYWGGLCVLFFLLQAVTGILLSVYYRPSAEDAFASIQFMNDKIEFGGLIRSLHYFSAHALIFTLTVHMISAFFMKAYRKPRELMWYTGLILLILVLISAFTGELLPWNELSYFGAVVGLSELEKFPVLGSWLADLARGGARVTGETLNRAYSMHAVILPITIFAVLIFHSVFGHIFKLSTPHGAVEKAKPFRFYNEFLYRMIIFMLTVLGFVTLVSLFFQKPAGVAYDMFNPTGAPAGIHPDWYFMWIYQLLSIDSYIPSFLISLVPLLTLLFLFMVPYFDNKFSNGRGGSITRNAGVLLIVLIVIFTIWGYINSGVSLPVISESTSASVSTGGIGRVYFAAIITFSISFLGLLIWVRLPKNNS